MSSEVQLIIGYLAVGIVGHMLALAGKHYGIHVVEDIGTRLEAIGGDWVKLAVGKRKEKP